MKCDFGDYLLLHSPSAVMLCGYKVVSLVCQGKSGGEGTFHVRFYKRKHSINILLGPFPHQPYTLSSHRFT